MITRFSIVTLVFFILSAIFGICPISFSIRLPYFRRIHILIGLTNAPIIAIAVLWASQCIGGTQIRDGIVGTGTKGIVGNLAPEYDGLASCLDGVKPYNILLLFISLAYMSITLDITGIFQAAAFWINNQAGSNSRKLFFYSYVFFALLGVALGNNPAILSGTTSLLYLTAAFGVEPIAWLIAEFAAVNTSSMVLFVGNPTNMIICEGLSINNVVFSAYTILPFFACTVACFAILAIQFHNPKYLARKISVIPPLNVRAALRDPVGALVGGTLLASCLVVIIIISFFKIDVWMISLPFAAAKLTFDLAWDYYRFVKGLSTLNHKQPFEDPVELEIKRALSFPPDGNFLQEEFEDKQPSSGRAMSPWNELAQETTSISENTILSPPVSIPRGVEQIHHQEEEEGASPFASVNTIFPTSSNASLDFTLVNGCWHMIGQRTRFFFGFSRETRLASSVNHQSKGPISIRTRSFFRGLWSSFTAYFPTLSTAWPRLSSSFITYFPTLSTAWPRLPFNLIPIVFSQFILIEALSHQGWIDIFANWLVKASDGEIYRTIWITGVLGVLMCNFTGTNIGATILLRKIVRAAPGFPLQSTRAAAIALAVASNIGAVNFVFSASPTGMLWSWILMQRGVRVRQSVFAFWNCLPLAVMTAVGLAVVSAEMAVLYPRIR